MLHVTCDHTNHFLGNKEIRNQVETHFKWPCSSGMTQFDDIIYLSQVSWKTAMRLFITEQSDMPQTL